MSGGVESCVTSGRCWREKGAEGHAHAAQCETQDRVWALKQKPLCNLHIGCNDTVSHSVERQLRVRVREKSPQKDYQSHRQSTRVLIFSCKGGQPFRECANGNPQ